MSLYLLQVSQDIDPAVKHPFPFCWVELMDEIGGVLLMAFLIPVNRAVLHSVSLKVQ